MHTVYPCLRPTTCPRPKQLNRLSTLSSMLTPQQGKPSQDTNMSEVLQSPVDSHGTQDLCNDADAGVGADLDGHPNDTSDAESEQEERPEPKFHVRQRVYARDEETSVLYE